MEFFSALLQHGFLQTAVLASLLASIGCGVIGTYVFVKRIALIAGGIAHSVLGGVGAAVYYQFDPLLGALITAIIAAILIGLVRLYWKTQEDTLIAALWAIGMAVGILFISKTPGYQGDLIHYLFGNILLVPDKSLWFMAVLDIILLAIVGLFHKKFLIVVFDEEFAYLRGVPVTFYYLLLLSLVAVSIVLLIQLVGLILVLALLTLPAAVASHYVHSLGKIMLFATMLGISLCISGLALSYEPDLPSGPAIVVLAGCLFIVSSIIVRIRQNYLLKNSISVRGKSSG